MHEISFPLLNRIFWQQNLYNFIQVVNKMCHSVSEYIKDTGSKFSSKTSSTLWVVYPETNKIFSSALLCGGSLKFLMSKNSNQKPSSSSRWSRNMFFPSTTLKIISISGFLLYCTIADSFLFYIILLNRPISLSIIYCYIQWPIRQFSASLLYLFDPLSSFQSIEYINTSAAAAAAVLLLSNMLRHHTAAAPKKESCSY
jgi:hypothetical protein